MHFHALDVALQIIRELRAPVTRIQSQDRSLADQVRRAATSISLNLAEGRHRAGKDRRHLWRVAAGRAEETRCCLRVAHAWGYVEDGHIAGALDLLDRLLAMTWRLTH